MAIYDLAGKALGVPVYALLGGAYRTEFEMLTNLYHKTPEAMAAACGNASEGFKGLKIKVGDTVLAKGWNRDNLLSELAILRAALDVVPADVYIDADANQGWRSAQWTVSVLKRFAGHDNLSIEQPLPHADLVGAAFVRAHAGRACDPRRIGVVAGSARRNIVRLGACDRMVLKLNRLGGFHPAAQAIAICEAAGIGVSVDTNPYTLVGDTACCHIAAIARTPYPVDCEGHVSFLDIGEPNPFRGGVTAGRRARQLARRAGARRRGRLGRFRRTSEAACAVGSTSDGRSCRCCRTDDTPALDPGDRLRAAASGRQSPAAWRDRASASCSTPCTTAPGARPWRPSWSRPAPARR